MDMKVLDYLLMRDDWTQLEIKVYKGETVLFTHDEDDDERTILVLDDEQCKEIYEFFKKHFSQIGG